MTGLRCFVAIELPESMRDEIGKIEEDLRTPGLRLVRPDLCHITLKFLGDVPPSRVDSVCEKLKLAKAEPFQVKVSGVGTFPGKSIRVVWLGLEGSFEELFRQVEMMLGPLGFRKEERKFSPHITLGRVGRPSAQISETIASRIAKFPEIDLGSFVVDRFFLKKSTLTRGGPIYENLAQFLLRPL
jgi:2'-5' RNA ligase